MTAQDEINKSLLKPVQDATAEIEKILEAMKVLNKKIADVIEVNKNEKEELKALATKAAEALMTSPKPLDTNKTLDQNLLPLAKSIAKELNHVHDNLSKANAQMKQDQRPQKRQGPEQKIEEQPRSPGPGRRR